MVYLKIALSWLCAVIAAPWVINLIRLDSYFNNWIFTQIIPITGQFPNGNGIKPVVVTVTTAIAMLIGAALTAAIVDESNE